MARPAKALEANSSNLTKKEQEIRKETERRLRGNPKKLSPPKNLTPEQKKYFKTIVKELEDKQILGNLDIYILARAAVTLDQIDKLDQMAKENSEIVFNNQYRLTKADTMKDFFRCCNELCLSPQARAKLSISAVKQTEEKKTIMDLLKEDDE